MRFFFFDPPLAVLFDDLHTLRLTGPHLPVRGVFAGQSRLAQPKCQEDMFYVADADVGFDWHRDQLSELSR